MGSPAECDTDDTDCTEGGQWTEYDGIKVMPTYHPAYLLRTPSAKKEVWQDMKKVMGELGIQF